MNNTPKMFQMRSPGKRCFFFCACQVNAAKMINHNEPKTATGTLNNSEYLLELTKEQETVSLTSQAPSPSA